MKGRGQNKLRTLIRNNIYIAEELAFSVPYAFYSWSYNNSEAYTGTSLASEFDPTIISVRYLILLPI